MPDTRYIRAEKSGSGVEHTTGSFSYDFLVVGSSAESVVAAASAPGGSSRHLEMRVVK